MATDRTPYLAIATIAAVAALAFFAGTLVSGLQRQDSGAPDVAGLLWPDPPALGEFALKTGRGKPFTRDDLLGRWTFIFFGFTHCPDVCPTTLDTLRQVSARLEENDSFAANGQVLFVSVDPERDTPEILRKYVAYFNEDFVGASAQSDALQRLTSQLGIVFAKINTAGSDDYTMDHSASILLVDPQARLLGIFSLPHVAADIAERFAAIADFYMRAGS